jgi:hypothetical protein
MHFLCLRTSVLIYMENCIAGCMRGCITRYFLPRRQGFAFAEFRSIEETNLVRAITAVPLCMENLYWSFYYYSSPRSHRRPWRT